MASKYYRGKQPNGCWWLQFYHPQDGGMRRFPLKTGDDAHADLIRQKFELRLALAKPEFADIEVPEEILAAVGLGVVSVKPEPSAPVPVEAPTPVPKKPRLTAAEAIRLYLSHIRAENDEHHVDAKISILRQFFGAEMLPYRRAPKNKQVEPPPFTGTYIDELDVTMVKEFINAKDIKPKSRRHYREVFHHFFQMLLDDGLIEPKTPYKPNPMHGLGKYLEKGRTRIVFLKPTDKAAPAKRDSSRQGTAVSER